jgi:hypothetical protein
MRFLLAAAAVFITFIAPLHAAEIDSAMLMYQAREPGIGSYPSRILVTERYVRMDDGVDDGDYLIFDRKSRLISSVTHDDKTVFEIPAREVTQEPPMALERRSEKLKTKDGAPAVAGKQTQHHQLFVNDKLCYNVVVVPGLMADAVTALRDFRQVLAGEHAKALPRVPADMQEACDLALNTFHADWQLQFGLPIQEWDESGNGQVLMDFKEGFAVDEALFSLPQGYQHYSTDNL